MWKSARFSVYSKPALKNGLSAAFEAFWSRDTPTPAFFQCHAALQRKLVFFCNRYVIFSHFLSLTLLKSAFILKAVFLQGFVIALKIICDSIMSGTRTLVGLM
jgi:hypothetical protein